IILALIANYGVNFGAGHAVEYYGETIENLSMEERMTICNMSVEGGAKLGMIAPDETTFAYVKGRPFAPEEFDQSLADWKTLYTDTDAKFDKVLELDVSDLTPYVTWGTNPGMGV